MRAGVQLDLLQAWRPFAAAANVLGYQRLGGYLPWASVSGTPAAFMPPAGIADVTAYSDVDISGARIGWARSHLQALHTALPWCTLGFLAAWRVQSQMATTATIGLTALVSIWAALAVMVMWSTLATCAYYRGRSSGVPDLLAKSPPAAATGETPWLSRVRGACVSLLKIVLAGVQPFLFSRTFCRILTRPALGWRIRLARIAVLGFGLTLFGVTHSHHMLHEAGYPDSKALRISLLGSVLNVTYRIFLSAILFHSVSRLFFPFII